MAHDTDARVQAEHFAVFRAMTPQRRVELAIEMSEELRAITLASIRSRNPSLTETQARLALIEMLYGVEVNSFDRSNVAG